MGAGVCTPALPRVLPRSCLCPPAHPRVPTTRPLTLNPNQPPAAVIEAGAFWRAPFRAMMTARQLSEYHVLDSEEAVGGAGGGGVHQHGGKLALAQVEVARAADFGANDRTYWTRTHLGRLLQPGDMAQGYDTANANLVEDEFEKAVHKVCVRACARWGWGQSAGAWACPRVLRPPLRRAAPLTPCAPSLPGHTRARASSRQGMSVPDVVLVRKSYEDKRKRRQRHGQGQQRSWKLKRMAVDRSEVDEGMLRGKQVTALEQEQADMEQFLQARAGALPAAVHDRLQGGVWGVPRAAAAAAVRLFTAPALTALLALCACSTHIRFCRSWKRTPSCAQGWRSTKTRPQRSRHGGGSSRRRAWSRARRARRRRATTTCQRCRWRSCWTTWRRWSLGVRGWNEWGGEGAQRRGRALLTRALTLPPCLLPRCAQMARRRKKRTAMAAAT